MKFERSKYNSDQILGYVFDEQKQALTTSLDAEMSIELSHKDGDSVLSVLPSLELSQSETASCVGINTVCLYVIKGEATVLVSPLSEGDVFIPLMSLEGQEISEIKPICAKRVKLVVPEGSEAYLCGQG